MNHLKYLIILFILFSSCKKEFQGTRPDAKINQLKDKYSKQLIGSKNGWIGYLYPKGGGGYTFKFNFNEKNRVRSYSTINQEMATKSDESSYRIAADQVVSLYFDTYSYLHQLSDPDERKSGGLRGGGKISDFEFSIIESSTDTLKLKGNHNESDLILIRAKDNEGDDFIKNAYELNNKIDELNQFNHYYNIISINKIEYGLIINTETSTITFYNDKDGKYNHFNTEYAMTNRGIVLKYPFEVDGLKIYQLENFQIDKANNKATTQINGTNEVFIKNISKPTIIDKDAPRRMYLINKMYSSSTGFTVAGKKDAVGIQKFPRYNNLLYIPRRYIDPFDALYIIYNDEYNVGPVFNTLYNDQGILSFKPFILITGFSPEPKYDETVISQNKLWFDLNGFYVFQTGNECFDFVSIKDSKVWIRFK